MALFKDTDIALLKKHIPVSGSYDINRLLTVMEDVEQEFTIPAIGQDQYDALDDAYNGGAPTAEQTALIAKIQAAQAPQAFLLGLPLLNVNISNTGFQIHVDENTKPAFQWQIDEVRDAIGRKAFNRVDHYLQFMEANKADYPLWTDSSAYTITRDLFINNATELTRRLSQANNSRQIFQYFRPFLLKAEERVETVTGTPLYEELKAEILADGVTASNQKLIDKYIQWAVAYLAAANALNEGLIMITPRALLIRYTQKTANTRATKNPNEQELSAFINFCNAEADRYLGGLAAYLDANNETFPLYEYDADYTGDFDNKEDSAIFKI